jgi:hypothetical protein
MSDPKAISEWRRQCQEELEELSRRRTLLVTAISHDDKQLGRTSLTVMELQLARQRSLVLIEAEIEIRKKEIKKLENK